MSTLPLGHFAHIVLKLGIGKQNPHERQVSSILFAVWISCYFDLLYSRRNRRAMRSLILFRHGKSDWDAHFPSDHERPLANRGKEAAICMGRMLSQAGQTPQLAVSSSALRARATLQLAVRAGRWHCPIRIEDLLYSSSAEGVLNWIRSLDENPDCLLLTGHEPTWSELGGRLIGDGSIRVPTGAMLKVDFEFDSWQQIKFGRGQLKWLMPPRLTCQPKAVK